MDHWEPKRDAFANSQFNPNLGQSGQKNGNSDSNLFVAGIPPEFTEVSFRNLFARYGKVNYVKLLEPKNPGAAKTGFVYFGSYYEAQEAMKSLNKCEIGQYSLHVAFAHPRKPKNQMNFQAMAEKVNVGPLIDADANQLIKQTQERFSSKYFNSQSSKNYLDNPLRSPPTLPAHPRSPQNTNSYSKNGTSSRSSNSHSRKPSLNNDGVSPHSPHRNSHQSSPNSNKSSKHNPCQICGKMTTKYCTSCRLAYYCSQSCQKQDWLKHKKICKMMSSENKNNFDSNDMFIDESWCQNLADTMVNSLNPMDVKPAIAPFPSDLQEGSSMDIAVIDINLESSYLVCQNTSASSLQNLQQLQVELNDFYNSQHATSLSSPAVGDVCAALYFEDKQWYRAKIREIFDNNKALIQYIDYGNSEKVKLSKLMSLNESFCKLPAFSMLCKLTGTNEAVSWTANQAEYLAETLKSSGMMLQAECNNVVGDVMYATLFSKGVSINDKMIRLTPIKTSNLLKSPLQSNSSSNSSKHESPPRQKQVSPYSSPGNKFSLNSILNKANLSQVRVPDKKFETFLCYIETPDSFYCQVVSEDLMKVHEFLPELNNFFSVESNFVDYHPSVGDICAALYQEDNQWCRAKVIRNVNSNVTQVFFVDFGNTAEVKLNHIQPLPNQYLSFPMQAFKAQLANCSPVESCWSSDAIEYFKSFENALYKANAVKHSNRGDSIVALILYNDVGKSLKEELVARGLALDHSIKNGHSPSSRTKKNEILFCKSLDAFVPPRNRKCQIVVSCMSKPGGFHCYVINDLSMSLEKLSKDLGAQCSRLQPPSTSYLVSGVYCAAYFEKRRMWCRAVVISVKKSVVQIQAVDYGNIAWIPCGEIRLLPTQFEQPPKLALTCRLADVEPAGSNWDHEYTNVIYNSLDASFDAMFVGKENDDYIVKVPEITNQLIQQHVACYCIDLV